MITISIHIENIQAAEPTPSPEDENVSETESEDGSEDESESKSEDESESEPEPEPQPEPEPESEPELVPEPTKLTRSGPKQSKNTAKAVEKPAPPRTLRSEFKSFCN